MMTLAELVALVEAKIEDQKPYLHQYPNPATRGLTSQNFVSELIETLNPVLSTFSPRQVREVLSGADTRIYFLATDLANWTEDFSSIVDVWFPYDSTEENQEALKQYQWELEKRIETILAVNYTHDALVFQTDTPAAAEEISILYKTSHDLSGAAITVPVQHVNAFADLVAGHYILGISSEFLQHVGNYITADVVSNLSPTNDAQSVALRFIKNFYNHFGVTMEDQTSAQSGWIDWSRAKGKTFFHEQEQS